MMYFTITYKDRILSFPGTDSVIIGQTKGCDIILPNQSRYEDSIIAKIIPNKNCDGWHIVNCAPCYPLLINGNTLNRVHYLSDGDMIETQKNCLRFNVKNGEQSAISVTHIHKTDKAVWGIIAALCLIVAILGYQSFSNSKMLITDSMKREIAASLFTTRVDSLQLRHCGSIVDSYTYASSPVGTAFLTTDSCIITARHCLQPWLNVVSAYEYSHIPESSLWPVKKALFVETENQLSGNEDWRIVSFVTLTDEKGKTLSLNSDDFMMNCGSDEIVELGSYNEPMFWRSISHRYKRRDMMLGDLSVAKTDRAGGIAVADEEEFIKLLSKRGTKLTFAGYPESGVNGNILDFRSDELRQPLEEMPEFPGHFFMLTHEGGLTPGFSGGPVIVRSGSGYKAVGVISVVDERNGTLSYSVPTTELQFIKEQ